MLRKLEWPPQGQASLSLSVASQLSQEVGGDENGGGRFQSGQVPPGIIPQPGASPAPGEGPAVCQFVFHRSYCVESAAPGN